LEQIPMAKKTKTKDDEQEDATSDGSIPVNDAWTGMLAISLLALLIGTGFLAWDWYSYYDDKEVKVPKLTGSLPQKPQEPGKPSDKVIEKKEDPNKDKDDKKDDKVDEKKDARLRQELEDRRADARPILIPESAPALHQALAVRARREELQPSRFA